MVIKSISLEIPLENNKECHAQLGSEAEGGRHLASTQELSPPGVWFPIREELKESMP